MKCVRLFNCLLVLYVIALFVYIGSIFMFFVVWSWLLFIWLDKLLTRDSLGEQFAMADLARA